MNEELEKLKSLLYTDSLTQYGKRKLMKTYKKNYAKALAYVVNG